MALNNTCMNLLGTYLTTIATHVSLHSADPGSTGTSEITAVGRKAATFAVGTDGDLDLTGVLNFTGGTPNAACTHVGLWSAGSGGTFRGGFALTGDQTLNAAGNYDVTELQINFTAS